MTTQLPLNLGLRDGASFENFYAVRNAEVVAQLTAAAGDASTNHTLFMWGEPASGKTHLLQSTCRLADERGGMCAYIPLDLAAEFSTGILEEMEQHRLVCLDDIHCIAGNQQWEAALFGFYERLRAAGGILIVTGNANPMHLGLRMPELTTRLGSGVVYHLQPLSDADKLVVLRRRAQSRGLEMPEEVARYVLHRYPRDLQALFGLLDRLDRASLAEQRRLTIPFIRNLE